MNPKKITRPNSPGTRLGLCGYAVILRQLQLEQLTSRGVSEAFHLGILSTRLLLGRMLDLGLVYRPNWIRERARGSFVPVWSAGSLPCAATPHGASGVKRVNLTAWNAKPELVAFASVVRALQHPSSLHNLVEQTGISFQHVSRLIRHCCAIGLVRVEDWEFERGTTAQPVYGLGSAPGKPKPPIQSRREIEQRYRQRRDAKTMMLKMIQATASNQAGMLEAA